MDFTRTEIRNIYENEFIGHREIVNELCDELDAKDALIAKYEATLEEIKQVTTDVRGLKALRVYTIASKSLKGESE